MRREYADVVLDAAIVSFAAVLFAGSVLGMIMYGITAKYAFTAILAFEAGYYGWRGLINGFRKIKAGS
jgi:hypothetical protein